MSSSSNDLLALWAAVAEAMDNPNVDGLIYRAGFLSSEKAAYAKIELYRIRKRARNQSKRNTDPDDPSYDTSPWDNIKIIHPGADRNGKGGKPELHFYLVTHSTAEWHELPTDIVQLAVPVHREKKPAKKKPST